MTIYFLTDPQAARVHYSVARFEDALNLKVQLINCDEPMQYPLFDTTPQTRTHQRIPASDDWQGQLQKIETERKQFKLINDDNLSYLYRSGASSKSDLIGLIKANVPICVNMLDTSAFGRELLIEYANRNGQLLLDSGAFRVFKHNIKHELSNTLDFQRVFKHYAEIIDGCIYAGSVIFVAPDVVGEQTQSLSLLLKYNEQIKPLLAKGASIMIPLQNGPQTLTECHDFALSVIPVQYHHQIVIGLPSNAEALSASNIISFLKLTKPIRVHFLGSSESQLVHHAKYVSPGSELSCDSTRIRKLLGQGKILTTMHRSIVDKAIEAVWSGSKVPHLEESGIGFDFTEFLGNLDDFISHCSYNELKRLAVTFGCSTTDLKKACDNDALHEYLDSLNYGYADLSYHLLYQFHEAECRRLLSPKIRQYSVTTLAKLGVI